MVGDNIAAEGARRVDGSRDPDMRVRDGWN